MLTIAHRVISNLASSLCVLFTTVPAAPTLLFLSQARLFPASRGTCAYAVPYAWKQFSFLLAELSCLSQFRSQFQLTLQREGP